MSPPRVIFLVGVSGSGKSTLLRALTERLGWAGLEGDEFHPPASVAKMRSGIPLDEPERGPWLAAIAAEVTRRRARGESLVVACSALKRAYRDRLRAAAPECLFVFLAASAALIEERVRARRGHFMPSTLVASQFQALEPPQPGEPTLVVPAVQPVERTVEAIVARVTAAGDRPAAEP